MKKILIKIFMLFFMIILINLFSFKTYAMYEVGGGSMPKGVEDKEESTVFGSASLIDCGCYDKVSKISEDNYKNSYIELDKYLYLVFRYSSLLDAPINRITNIEMLEKGNSLGVSYTFTKSMQTTYEKALKKTISNSTSISFKNGVNLYNMFESSNEISNQISSQTEYETRFSKIYTISEGYTISQTVSPKEYDSYWSYATRAKFNVYKICVYEYDYDQTKESHKTWYGKKYNTYSYTKTGAHKVEESYRYEYENSTLYEGLFEYIEVDGGKYKLKNKNASYTYLD